MKHTSVIWVGKLLALAVLFSQTSNAHNSVVVIPMAGDDVEVGIHLDRTQIVGGSGTPTENGAALVSAVNFVNDQGATQESPWLIKLEPGTYDLGTGTIELNDYVSMQGAYMRLTKIESATAAPSPAILEPGNGVEVSELWIDATHTTTLDVENLTLTSISNVVLRNLKLTNVGNQSDAIDIAGCTDLLIAGVVIRAADFGIFLSGGNNDNVIIRESQITSTGDEAFNAGNSGDSSTIANSTITSLRSGTSAVNSFGGSTVIRHSNLISSSGGSVNTSSSATNASIEIYNSFVDVDEPFSANFSAGTALCSGISSEGSFSTTTCL